MFNKKKFERIDLEIGKLWAARIDGDKNVNCIKCGMLGLKSKMKMEKKIQEERPVLRGWSWYLIPECIVTEYICIHCQKKGKKKTA